MSNLRDELQRIYEHRGELTPDTVVEEATPKNHPLHDRLTWDNRVAGHKYRLIEAHELIRSVKVSYRKTPTGKDESIRAFHAIRRDDKYVYEPIEDIVADPMATKILLAEMERDYRTLRARYEQFDEFWQLLRAEVAAA
jgi:hypothetical protein